jgi:hypothetical protein
MNRGNDSDTLTPLPCPEAASCLEVSELRLLIPRNWQNEFTNNRMGELDRMLQSFSYTPAELSFFKKEILAYKALYDSGAERRQEFYRQSH